MLKNAFLSLKKNIGKTILLFVIMFVIANLIIAGISINNASNKAMDSLQSSMGNDVTLTTNFKKNMASREQGQSVSDVTSSVTIDMADQLNSLKYVDSYNYTISTTSSSSDITAVESTSSSTESDSNKPAMSEDSSTQQSSGDFSISANSTMKYLDDFTNKNYNLISGRLLTTSDSGTTNCVIETNLAKENNLSVGSTFTITSTVDSNTYSSTVTVVGIYEISSDTQVGGMNRNNPVNTIYTDLSVGQTLTNSTTNLTSATYYLNDPENADAFTSLAKEKTNIDFDKYTLDTNNQMYEQNASMLESASTFSKIFLAVVIIAGSAILALILILTIRNRYYEFGVFLSLGQSKLKIILQQLIEIGVIGLIAFTISLGTGQMISNVVSGMLESSSTTNEFKMDMNDSSNSSSSDSSSSSSKSDSDSTKPDISNAFKSPTDTSLNVSMNTTTAIEVAGITTAICVVSTLIPSVYILRLSPREILSRKEG
ncbi:MAG: ABC transporter permease [Thomasclavelia sp.]|jgi:putative ABC transport system permease protein|nr:ABC transporter permease [Thomasclavelia sp.]